MKPNNVYAYFELNKSLVIEGFCLHERYPEEKPSPSATQSLPINEISKMFPAHWIKKNAFNSENKKKNSNINL